MPIPYSLLNLKAPDRNELRAWNDPRRELYPNHAEFWSEEVPEHIVYQREALTLRRRKRRALLLSFVRFEWLRAIRTFARKPSRPATILEDPMTPQQQTKSGTLHRITGASEPFRAAKPVAPGKAQPVCTVSAACLPADDYRAGCR